MSRYFLLTAAELVAEHDRLRAALGEPKRASYRAAWFYVRNGLPGRPAQPLRRAAFEELLESLAVRVEALQEAQELADWEAQEAHHWDCRDVPTGPRFAPENYALLG